MGLWTKLQEWAKKETQRKAREQEEQKLTSKRANEEVWKLFRERQAMREAAQGKRPLEFRNASVTMLTHPFDGRAEVIFELRMQMDVRNTTNESETLNSLLMPIENGNPIYRRILKRGKETTDTRKAKSIWRGEWVELEDDTKFPVEIPGMSTRRIIVSERRYGINSFSYETGIGRDIYELVIAEQERIGIWSDGTIRGLSEKKRKLPITYTDSNGYVRNDYIEFRYDFMGEPDLLE